MVSCCIRMVAAMSENMVASSGGMIMPFVGVGLGSGMDVDGFEGTSPGGSPERIIVSESPSKKSRLMRGSREDNLFGMVDGIFLIPFNS